MPNLSVVMIVRDEADCLAECLGAVRDIADELVIGDTGSTDASPYIVQRYGARVINVPWRDDFAAARNAVLAAAVGDWLLHLDADEVVPSETAARIRTIVDADGEGADAIEVVLANYCNAPRAWRWRPCEPGASWARGYSGYIPVGLPRLFRNHRGFEYREAIHESITESVLEKGGRVRSEPLVIHHYGYGGGGEGKSRRKLEQYLSIARRKVEDRPDDIKAWRDLAEQALAAGHAEEAEQACRQARAIDPAYPDATITLANLHLNRGELDEARVILEQLEAVGAAPSHAVTALAAVDCRQGRLDQARERLEAVLSHEPNHVMAHLYMARVFDRMGKPDRAREHLRRATETAPALDEPVDRFKAHVLRQNGEALVGQGLHEDALRVFVKALERDSEDAVTHNDIGVVLHHLGRSDQARASFERALRLAPGMTEAAENLQALGE